MRKGFTIIEMIVVISIIALLSSIAVNSYTGISEKARDTRRKDDLRTISTALNAYYAANGKYPTAGSCVYGTNCFVSSADGDDWIPALIPTYADSLPIDPINNIQPRTADSMLGAVYAAVTPPRPWYKDSVYYVYSYGYVTANGQSYDLTARLEGDEDPDRCGVKLYKYYNGSEDVAHCDGNDGGAHSDQVYELSPLTR
ncbi:MAG: type II secretion system protein [Weeksellaceae bacterium]